MNDGGIVDAHVHMWEPGRLGYPWLEAVPALKRPFLPADYAAAAPPGSAQFVFVEAGAEAAHPLREAAWVSGLAEREPGLAGIVAYAPLERGQDARACLEALAQFPLVKGIRRMIQTEKHPGFCLEPRFLTGVRMLAEFDFSFDLCILHSQLPAAIELARHCPDVRFVLDHLGKPAIRQVRDVGAANHRGHVMLAVGLEVHVGQHHDPVVVLDLLEG